MLKKGEQVALVCCSDGLKEGEREQIARLSDTLKEMGLIVVESSALYQQDSVFSGTARERARVLEAFYRNPDIKAIFDVSGGNAANGLLTELDFSLIKQCRKPFFGYSDLTTIINSIFVKTGIESGLYQIRNLVGKDGTWQRTNFYHTLLEGKDDLLCFSYQFLRGDCMEGVIIGGNIRCLLKLAGTPFWPDMKEKILFLESNGGETALIYAYINQLKQMGVLEEVKGILLGTFTNMEKKDCRPTAETMVLEMTGTKIPIAKTQEIGHGSNSKCLFIGRNMVLTNEKERT